MAQYADLPKISSADKIHLSIFILTKQIVKENNKVQIVPTFQNAQLFNTICDSLLQLR